MIKTLYQIGRAFSEEPEFAHYFKPWQNPYPRAEEATVLVIDVKDQMLVTPIKAPEVFRNQPEWLEKYLFRNYKGKNGAHITPTSWIFIPKKKDEWAENLRRFYSRLKRTFEDNRALTEMYLNYDVFWEVFKPSFESVIKEISTSGNLLVTFRFDNKYIGETNFKQLLYDKAYDEYKQTEKAIFVGFDHTCSVTQEISSEVWGKVGILGFTVDAEPFIRGGFKASEAWKMFPVSKEVVPILDGARGLVFDRLRFGFFKLSYLIVPRFIGWGDDEIRAATQWLLSSEKSTETFDAQNQAIINTEDRIMEILEDALFKKPGVSFDFFFYQQEQAQLSVKLHLTDVMPSRMREISEKKKAVENRYRALINKEEKGKKRDKIKPYALTFSRISEYFSVSIGTGINKKTIFHPIFFQILEAVFYRQHLPEEFILKAFHEKLVVAFKNYDKEAYQFANHGFQSFAFYQYLAQLGIFHHKPALSMENQPVALTLDEFLAQHSNDFLKEPERKAAFLAGCLVERLLAVQYKEMRSEPFRKYLHNLQLDTARLLKIMVKWEEKVQEYVRAGHIPVYRENEWSTLKAEVFAGLAAAASQGARKNTAFSYAFTMGMIMQKAFTNEAIRKAVAAKKAKQETDGN